MFCTKCGNKLNENLNFCPTCGNQIKNVNNINNNVEINNVKQNNSNPTVIQHPQKNSYKIVIVFVILGVLLGSLSLFNIFNETKNNNDNDFVGEWYCYDYYSTNTKYNHKVLINSDNTYIYGDSNDFDENHYKGSYELSYGENNVYKINFKLDYMIVDGKEQTPKNEYMRYYIKHGDPLYNNTTIVRTIVMESRDTYNSYVCLNQYVSEYELSSLKSFY